MPLYQTYHLLAVATKSSLWMMRTIFFGLFLFLLQHQLYSQDQLQLENGDLEYINPNEQNAIQWLLKNESGQARLRQKNTTIEADSIRNYAAKNYAEAKGNVYINQADSIDIYSHTAQYYGNERRATLQGEVVLIQGIYTLQTDQLNYNVETRTATYTTGGELSDTTSVLTSKKGSYNLKTETAVFTDSVVLISPERKINTEQLTYFLKSKWAEFTGPTTIYEQDQLIKTTKGRYNTETGEADIKGNPIVENKDAIFKADHLQLDKKGGIGEATGNVYYLDKENHIELHSDYAKQLDSNRVEATGNVLIKSLEDSITLTAKRAILNNNQKEFSGRENVVLTMHTQQTELLADSLDFFDKQGYAIAQGRPFLTTVNEGDSIYMIANTIEAFRQDSITTDTVYNYVIDENVKLYKSDLQAVADSAYVNNIDSTITLYNQPAIWSDSTQMTADTIKIFLKDKQIQKVEFLSNAFFINLENEDLFNQMKGKRMEAYFKNDELDSVIVDGNAETIYYAKDEEDAYIGVDKMQSGQIIALFNKGELKEVIWLKQQEGTTTPFQTINPKEFRFNGFYWREAERPYSKDYLLIFSGRKEGTIPEIPEINNRDKQENNAIQLGGKKDLKKNLDKDD